MYVMHHTAYVIHHVLVNLVESSINIMLYNFVDRAFHVCTVME